MQSSRITAVRDACCHIDSFKRNFDAGGSDAFNAYSGKGIFAKIGNVTLRSDYEDDLAFFYGTNRVYLKRHVIRAFKEAVRKLQDQLRDS